jgi:5-methylcytosine-specific restriction endonuclease McrA
MAKKIDFGIRPKCSTLGCTNDCQVFGRKKDGSARFRTLCQSCHSKKVAAKHGLNNLQEVVAKNAGFDNVTQYTNSIHPYRKYRKTYCENVDARLGFKCTTTILLVAQLEVDHKDGNPSNNNEDNLQTLCGCCHKYKTIINEDYSTPGRKELGVTY